MNKLPINAGGTMSTAFLRAGISAVVVLIFTMAVTWVASDNGFFDKPVLAAGLAAFGATGFMRAIVEGSADSARQMDGSVLKSDVQPGKGKPGDAS